MKLSCCLSLEIDNEIETSYRNLVRSWPACFLRAYRSSIHGHEQCIRNARTRADHSALAQYYENAAKRMQAKAKVERNMMNEYTQHGYYYGRRTEDLQEHTEAMVRVYEEGAEANSNMAKFHRRLAEDASE